MTGTAVKRSKKEVWVSNSGSNLGLCAFPSKSAEIAITELMATNTTARSTDIAEVNLKDPGNALEHDNIRRKYHHKSMLLN